MQQISSGTRLDHGLSDLVAGIDVVLCDVWGVVHNGVRHFENAVGALQTFRRGGGTVVLVTNAPVPAAQVGRRLKSLHVPDDAFDAIATSGDVTVAAIVERGCPPLFGIGPLEETALYHEARRLGPRNPTRVPIEQAELVLCIGLDETGTRPEDYDPTLARLFDRDLEMICANPDLVVEMGETLEYCAGAIADRYAAMGGVVLHAGKPYPAIYALALDLARETRGHDIGANRVLAIGDAVRTDLIGARDRGFAALFITAGIHRDEVQPAGSDGRINPVALERLLQAGGVTPLAALAELEWSLRPPLR